MSSCVIEAFFLLGRYHTDDSALRISARRVILRVVQPAVSPTRYLTS